KGSCVITKSTLKVLLESEYLQLPQTPSLPKRGIKGEFDNNQELQSYCESQLKELILPNLTHKVNHDPSYEPLRQIYNAIILAKWYKNKVLSDKDYELSKNQDPKKLNPYNLILNSNNNPFNTIINANNLNGLISKEPVTKEQIFAAYLDSVKQGEYHLSKTNYNPELKANIRRSYVSGGAEFTAIALTVDPTATSKAGALATDNLGAAVILTAEQNDAINQAISDSFTTTNEDEKARDVTEEVIGYTLANGVRVFICPSLSQFDNQDDFSLVAHAGRGGVRVVEGVTHRHTLRQIYLSPKQFEFVQGLTQEAQEAQTQFWTHEIAHIEHPEMSEEEVQAIAPTDKVREKLVDPDFKRLIEAEKVLNTKGLDYRAYQACANAIRDIAQNRPDLADKAMSALEKVLLRDGLDSSVYE
ncbi:MAG: hypothetical protein AB1755_03435, partial [Candidatus Omnitrophota bacterium]